MALGGPEQVPGWFMMAVGGVGQPTSDLSLRFPLFFCNFQCFGAFGRSRCTPVLPNRPEASKGGSLSMSDLKTFGPWRGTFNDGI